ncbi:DUF6153 family protein [Actinomadura rupiterrae]|uniref:DUF6153 family protein n=1 Tax=Actinomadura rupiterrae TaxID=559627 RepID=UPI0020A4A24B|nr:DUF6153 family protein [Actinomadura rupiterrae]MCP2336900.1 hypothetical protein [Actinomadura rupiterrae]
MNGRGVSRGAALALLLGALLAGLFLMHGVSASPSPIHFSDPVQVASAHHMPDGMPGPSVSAHAAMAHDMGGCLGGTVCLALLVFGVLAVALAGRSVALLPARPPSGEAWTRRRGPPSARPPDLHRLCVLRL